MQRSAPYADTPIPLFLGSSTGLRYRTLSCMECGSDFFERNADIMLRIGDKELPQQARLDSTGRIPCVCGKCSQKYTITISLHVETNRGVPLYMQPQSIYIANAPRKRLRDVYCLECGKAFYSISDRIQQVVDNVTPNTMITGLGPMEARCKFQHCKQRWQVRV